MKISIYQYDIAWEEIGLNLNAIEKATQSLVGTTDLIVLPEMATTGFTMSPGLIAQTMRSESIIRIQQLVDRTKIALIGSFVIENKGDYFNRAILFTPDQECQYYDKRHLFRMGTETDHYTAGKATQQIFHYKGWNIRILICYDLRFPVWSRNINNQYDLLIYCANWPKVRTSVWNVLLPARAIENMAYVCGVNRIGKDGNGLDHEGCSQMIDYKGNLMSEKMIGESIQTYEIDLQTLKSFRTNFPVWMDSDPFLLIE